MHIRPWSVRVTRIQDEAGKNTPVLCSLITLIFWFDVQVPNYRTTLCQTWSTQGSCSYGDTCMYAHGNHELRVKNPASDLAELGISGPDTKRIRLWARSWFVVMLVTRNLSLSSDIKDFKIFARCLKLWNLSKYSYSLSYVWTINTSRHFS